MGDFVKWLGSAAGSDDHDGAVTEHSAEESLSYFDGFDLVEQHFNSFAAGQPGLDDDAVIGDGHFRRVAANHADENHYNAANKQRHASPFHRTQVSGLDFVVSERVIQEKRTREREEQAAYNDVPEHDDPMEPGFVDDRFARNEVSFDVAHRRILANGREAESEDSRDGAAEMPVMGQFEF